LAQQSAQMNRWALTLISRPSQAYALALLGVALATVLALFSLADQEARKEAFFRNPIVRDISHCAAHHGTVARLRTGQSYCRILVL
jgi:hypothetical protein